MNKELVSQHFRKFLSPRRNRYPTEVTDAEGAIIAPMILSPRQGGRYRNTDVREFMNAFRYVLRTGRQGAAVAEGFFHRASTFSWEWTRYGVLGHRRGVGYRGGLKKPIRKHHFKRCTGSTVAAKLHKLAALRLLAAQLGGAEELRQQQIDAGEDASIADRNAAQTSLAAALAFFQTYGIETRSLSRLLADLAALSEGSTPSAMFKTLAVKNRRPDPPLVQSVKGRLAAAMEYRQRAGYPRSEAAKWLFRHLTASMKRQLGVNSATTVDGWLARWGGHKGPASNGRQGYQAMAALLERRRPSEVDLKKLVKAHAKHLLSEK